MTENSTLYYRRTTENACDSLSIINMYMRTGQSIVLGTTTMVQMDSFQMNLVSRPP